MSEGGRIERPIAKSIYYVLQSIARAGRFNDLDMPVEEALEARPKVKRNEPLSFLLD